jgi:RHS repeat-associated protein
MDGTAMKRLLCAVLAMIVASAALAATPPKRAAVDTAEAWASGLAYTYDPSGSIRTIGTHSYYYDTAGRLVYGTADSASNAQQFEYDAFGNRTSAARTENAQNCFGGLDCEQSPAVDPQTNRLIAAGVIAYDAAGNLTQANTNYQYSFDAVGAMTSSTKPAAQYIYTADDERIAVYSGEWRWTVRDLGAHVLREYTSQGTGGQSQWMWSRDHIYRGALPLASVTAAGTLHLHLDHLGTPRLITDAGGTLVAEHAYYAFGTELSLPLSESPREKLHFTGHERDETADVLQLDYMHARYYGAALGRFVSVDPDAPWMLQGGSDRDRARLRSYLRNPQNWNRYVYVRDNPIGRTDPTGRCIEDACIGEAVVVGAVALAESPAGQAAIEGGEEELVALSERYGPEVAAEAQSAFEATARSLRSIDLGRIGERALGVFNQVKERIASATETAHFRIPDLLDKANKVLADAKNVSRLSMSNQLRDFAAYAQANGYQLVIGVRTGTVLSKPVQALVDSGLIKIVYMKIEQ